MLPTVRLMDTAIFNLDGQAFKNWIRAGMTWLERHHEAVNRLNVFPVPDGDTGTNMLLTVRAAYSAIINEPSQSAGVIAEKLANGALHGSRGNSGTVLSQFFRGFARAFAGLTTFEADHLAYAFREAARLAYQTFQKPTEGTILTVAREIAEEVETLVGQNGDLQTLLTRAVERGRQAVARTPELLPILRKAGVVDSGGQGLVVLLEGMLRALKGTESLPSEEESQAFSAPLELDEETLRAAFALSEEHSQGGFGYDVQYLVRGQALDVDRIRAHIAGLGESPIVVGDSTEVKVHVHVHDPQTALAYGYSLGTVSDIVIENMQEQSEDYLRGRTVRVDDTPFRVSPDQIAVIAVTPGEGLRRLFYDQRAAGVVAGGQTMNPSAGELLRAVQETGASRVILLPNNPNVILTAQAAAALAQESGIAVQVIPTRSIPQGIAALIGAYDPDGDLASISSGMAAAAQGVRSGEITRATRTIEIDQIEVEQGQFIGLIDDQLTLADKSLPLIAERLLESMIVDDHEVVTFYYGDSVSETEAEELYQRLSERFPHLGIEMVYGDQPFYPYLIGLE